MAQYETTPRHSLAEMNEPVDPNHPWVKAGSITTSINEVHPVIDIEDLIADMKNRPAIYDAIDATPEGPFLPWSCGWQWPCGSQHRWGSKSRKPIAAKRDRSNCARRRNRGARGRLGVLRAPAVPTKPRPWLENPRMREELAAALIPKYMKLDNGNR